MSDQQMPASATGSVGSNQATQAGSRSVAPYNCEKHARPPYALRVFHLAGVPIWCEVVDSDPGLGWIPAALDHSRPQTALDLFAESGRGLVLVRELSRGTAAPTPRRPSPPKHRPRPSPSPCRPGPASA
ncbi:hypothetical protein ABT061_18515 [Streptosporangium sp. NPDC002544]|uniref:hypothetical protein n=1 Tax=Streptosporangium sp. NPDC002544 TaxID=3154538 RepID=UPI0033229141